MKRYTLTLVLFVIVGLTAPAAAQEAPVRIIFMHHSTGLGLITQGGVRPAFSQLGYEFWDHGYNEEGLVDASGNWLGINWEVPDDNTDPDGWYAIFDQPVTDPPANTFSHMLEYDVIIFKSCFPSSDIYDEDMFQAYQQYFLSMRDVMDQHPDKLFIPFTPPPLVPNETSPENAARARRWSEYLTSPEYLEGHPNIAVFDFFSTLADEDGFLRAEYRSDEWDSHPNQLANSTVGPVFVEFVDQAIRAFEPGEAVVQPEPADQVESDEPADDAEPVGEAGQSEENMAADGVFDPMIGENFEWAGAREAWWEYVNEPAETFECNLDTVEDGQAMRFTFDIPPGGSAGCGVNFDTGPAWADSTGITFRWRTEPAGLILRFGLAVFDPELAISEESATPFEIELVSENTDWTPVTFTWDQLVRVDWMGETGINEFDPTHVVWLALDVGHWETPQAGSFWIDDIQLVQ